MSGAPHGCERYSSASGISGAFSYSGGNLSVTSSNTVTLAAGSYCFASISLSGSSSLAVSGPVTITLTGNLSDSGSGTINTSQIPANLQLAFAGSGGEALTGTGSGYMSVYAPGGNVAISGGGQLFGAVLARNLTISGGSAIHFDTQLLTVWNKYFAGDDGEEGDD